MLKEKVLFVCIHNSARSQMAEAFLKQFAGDRFEAQNAGTWDFPTQRRLKGITRKNWNKYGSCAMPLKHKFRIG